jgi:hypothetical protein
VHVRNARVAGQRYHICPNCPDVNIVDFLHAFNTQDRARNGF